MRMRLTRDQTYALELGALEAWDDIVALVHESADEHGQTCELYNADGDLIHTAEPTSYCRACHENPRATDSHDPRYCWACLREFGDD